MPTKTRLFVALAVLAAAGGGGCGRIQLDDGPGAGDGGDVCEGLTDSSCSSRPGCVVANVCHCPWQPATRCVAVDSGTPLNCTAYIVCSDPCAGLLEDACRAQPSCTAATCPGCGGSTFAGCLHVGSPPPQCPPLPPCVPPLPCDGLAEAACAMAQGCTPMYCGGCQGQIYIGCGTGTGGHSCPAVICPPPCSTQTTAADCNARADCHSVFIDSGVCDCATAGCCAHFSRCADGPADCRSDNVGCNIAAPSCEGPYVVSYSGICYEGCVLATACAQ
jgi:hypothetical protein